jgi:hypothetical protein
MIKHCEWCDESFDTTSKNQIYCDAECRTNATKQKIVQRYKITKAQERIGKDRRCAGNCDTILSIYNDNGFCDSCLVNNKKLDRTLKEIKDFFDYEQK